MQCKILVFGYGNPGRLDDGLGPAFAEEIGKLALPGVVVDADYQLTVEDAAQISEFDVVLFADASVDGIEPFELVALEPARESAPSFSSHQMTPQAVLGLAESLFGKCPEAHLLGIRGYEYNEFGERLSDRAQENLKRALVFAREFLDREGVSITKIGKAT